MRLFLATILALASAGTSIAQAPTAIREVAKLVEMRTHAGTTYPVFDYEGVFVLGDVSLQDYNDATGVVRRELREGEQIVQVVASQQVPLMRQNHKDLSVQTCIGPCGKGVKTADGKIEVTPGGEGRYFIFERVALKLQLRAMWDWIA
jgi:predicted sugar kinase